LFDLLIVIFALVLVAGWALIYAAAHGKTLPTPGWVEALRVRLYILLLNRLYLDALSARLRAALAPALERADQNSLFTCGVAAFAIAAALLDAGHCHRCSRSRLAAFSLSRNLRRRADPRAGLFFRRARGGPAGGRPGRPDVLFGADRARDFARSRRAGLDRRALRIDPRARAGR